MKNIRPQQPHGFKMFYAISFATQLGFLIVAPLLGFLLLGRWVDAYLGTAPLLMLVGMTLGLAVTSYELFHSILPLIQNHDTDQPTS